MFPVTINQIRQCEGNVVELHGNQAEIVTFVGLVKKVECVPNETKILIDDQTGIINALDYMDVDGEGYLNITKPTEGTYCRIVGLIRGTTGRKHIKILKCSTIEDLNELTCHLLEVIQLRSKIGKSGQVDLGTTAAGSSDNFTVGCGAAEGTMDSNTDVVLSAIKEFSGEEGMHKNNIIQQLKNQLTVDDISDALVKLGEQGSIFMMNEDYFKATDFK